MLIKEGLYLMVIHPYAGMVRIRFEGIISARQENGHPLNFGCKDNYIFHNRSNVTVKRVQKKLMLDPFPDEY